MFSDKWKEILDEVNDFSKDSNVWFRGHLSKNYKLNSGLFRLDLDSIDKYISLESQLYTYYKNLGYLLHREDNPWHLLYSMQHYGVKTRLLDWTESFAVSLFFASENWDTGTARIWILKPLMLNQLSRDKQEIVSPNKLEYPGAYKNADECLTSIAIYPIKNSNRIISQHGLFTIQGNLNKPLDQEFNGELIKQEILKPIDLTLDVKEDVIQYLKQNGINKYSLFPDLDGLSSHINKLLIPPHSIE
ncbi:FRG domain-containing protein [Priestia endophytica]|uniref:FRG domain-containing protein n=1 Tax=Priestia endophytica TaxID=135735 RepID=UPI00124BEE4E|nr:FRG domain-containing protein [Priestia endophytica]KAB2489636.1 FRG domain-containing protein [Priestia endophytica]